MVLGMLALVTMMVIAFAILMRQEQGSSAAYQHKLAANTMLYTAVGQALTDLNRKAIEGSDRNNRLTDANWPWTFSPQWNDGWIVADNADISRSDHVRGPEDVLFSVWRKNQSMDPFLSFMLHREMGNYFTRPFMRRITETEVPGQQLANRLGQMTLSKAEWCPLYALDDKRSGYRTIEGRFCYAMANTSSLLDVNEVGGVTRGLGASPREIKLDYRILPDFDTAQKVTGFLNARSRFGLIHSLDELTRLSNPGSPQDPNINPNRLASFRVFSKALPELVPSQNWPAASTTRSPLFRQPKINIRTLADMTKDAVGTELAARDRIIQALQECVVTENLREQYDTSTHGTATRIYYAMCDFVDDRFAAPHGNGWEEKYKRATVKAIPLPYILGIRARAGREDVKEEINGVTTVTEVRITVLYQFTAFFFNDFRDKNGQASLGGNMDVNFMVKARAPDIFDSTLHTTMPELFLFTDASPGGRWTRFDHVESIGSGDTSVNFTYRDNNSRFAPEWIECIHTFAPADVPETLNLNHVFGIRATLSHDGTELLRRPAYADDDEESSIQFYAGLSFDTSRLPEDPLDRQHNAQEFWSEALDPRFAWSENFHWVPSDVPRDGGRHIFNVTDYYADKGRPTPGMDRGGMGALMSWLLAHQRDLKEFQDNRDLFDQYPFQVDGQHNDGADLDSFSRYQRAYVKHSALENVGELAYIPLAPWFSITLSDPHYNPRGYLPTLAEKRPWSRRSDKYPQFHRVLDYFTVNDGPVKGKVNLNSTYRTYDLANKVTSAPALASVLADTPLELYPANAGGELVRLKTDKPTPSGGYVNCSDVAIWLAEKQRQLPKGFSYLSDLAALYEDTPSFNVPPADQPFQALIQAFGSSKRDNIGEWEREALIANTAGLFTLRDQTYTVFIRADSFKSGFGNQSLQKGAPLGTAYAVMDVWRDPIPTYKKDANGKLVEPLKDSASNPYTQHPTETHNFRFFE